MLGVVEQLRTTNRRECGLKIKFDEPIGTIWCFSVTTKEYPFNVVLEKIETKSYYSENDIEIEAGKRYNFNLSIAFAGGAMIKKQADVELGFKQMEEYVTHTIFTAKVQNIKGDLYICDAGNFGDNINVFLEDEIFKIEVGEVIEFCAEIAAEVE